jgi:hypothetical protein
VPAATDLDHVACPPNQWSYAIPPNPEKQVQQLLGEHRRLAQHVAFLRNPIEAVDSARAWPPPSPRKRTPFEDLILSAWDNPAPVPPAVDTLLAEHVHDSVAHFTSWPCALYDRRGVYCDKEKFYADTDPRDAGVAAV